MTTFRSISTLTVLNVIGAVIGVANSVVVARLFGTSTEVAVYFGASTLLAMMISLTQTGQLVEIFLPLYHRKKEAVGDAAARRAFSVIFNRLGLYLLGGCLLLLISSPVLIGLLLPGFEPEARELGVKVFALLVPLVGLRPLKALMQMLANAERQFGKPESFGVAGNAAAIVTVLALAPTFGVWALVGALWVADIVGMAGLAFVLWRFGYRHRLILGDQSFDHRAVFKQLLNTVWYLGSTQLYAFVLNAGLSMLSESTFAVFKYVQAIFSRTNTILLRPFSTVFFTHFSEAVGRGMQQLWSLGRRALSQTFAAASIAFVAIVVAGLPLLSALWGGEKFGSEELELAHRLLAFMFLLLYGTGAGQIARKASMSLGQVRPLYLGMSVVQLLCAAAAWPLITGFGVGGVLATLALNVVGLSAIPILLILRSFGHLLFYPLGTCGKWSLGVGIAIAAGLIPAVLIQTDGILFPGAFGLFLWSGLLAFLSLSVLLATAWLANAHEARSLVNRLLRISGAARLASADTT